MLENKINGMDYIITASRVTENGMSEMLNDEMTNSYIKAVYFQDLFKYRGYTSYISKYCEKDKHYKLVKE